MKSKIIIVILFLLINCLSAQILTKKQENQIKEIISHYYGKHSKTIVLDCGLTSFAISGNDTFFCPQGYHYIFKIKHDTVIRLDESNFHGGNFSRYQFVLNNKIYHLGGYGLYNTNNNLEVFDLSVNKWRLERTTGEKPEYINGVAIHDTNFLYSFFNYKSGNNVEEDIFDNNVYSLDLKTFNWKKFSNINFPNVNITIPFYTNNYIVITRGNMIILIHKKHRKYLEFSKDLFYISTFEIAHKIDGDRIQFGDSLKPFIDLDLLWIKNENLSKLLVLEPMWYQLKWVKSLLIYSIILLVIAISTYLFVRKRKLNQTINSKEQNELKPHPLFDKIQNSSKTHLDINELDELLSINHMEVDSKKLKRHRILGEIEKIHPNLIERQKDESDKRRFIYIIGNKN